MCSTLEVVEAVELIAVAVVFKVLVDLAKESVVDVISIIEELDAPDDKVDGNIMSAELSSTSEYSAGAAFSGAVVELYRMIFNNYLIGQKSDVKIHIY